MTNLSTDAKNFVNGIVDHLKKDKGGSRPIPKVKSLLRKVSDSSWKEKTARITTAVALDQSEMDQIQHLLSNRLDKNILLNCSVNPNIIGGIRIEIGDSIIDLSYEEQLRRIQAMLMKGNTI